MVRPRPDDEGAPDAEPADTDGAADCEVEPADAVDDAAGVVPGNVPECNPSDGVFTGGVWTGVVVVDGVLTDGVVRLGVLTGGVLIGPTVTGGTVAVGAVTDGAVTEGADTVGTVTVRTVTVGTPTASASPAEVAATTNAAHVTTTASGRLMDVPSGRRTTYLRTSASTLHTDPASGKVGSRAYTTRAPDQMVGRVLDQPVAHDRSDGHRHRVRVEYDGPVAAAALGRVQGAIDALEHRLDLERHRGGR